MQQTEKYKLNLIETSDPFSPSPLNENMEKVEATLQAADAALAAETTARAEADADLDERLKVFEAKRFVIGSYTGDGAASKEVMLGFTPKMVLAMYTGGGVNIALWNNPILIVNSLSFEIIDGGVRTFGQYNLRNDVYYYLAID